VWLGRLLCRRLLKGWRVNIDAIFDGWRESRCELMVVELLDLSKLVMKLIKLMKLMKLMRPTRYTYYPDTKIYLNVEIRKRNNK
jgi:hypothetical protein